MTSRVALVTGGTGGIGTAIVKRLADMGHKVATNYRNEEKARAWQDKMKAEGYDIAIVKGDVTSPEEAEAMVREVEAALGPVEILVNNAGITRDGTFHRMKAGQWTDVINTNLNSVFNVTRPVIEGMRERKWGRIIQISSINGLKGQYGQANYAAAKEEVRAKIVADIPTGRLGTPEEIAYGVGFLADEQASWITGSNLDINGGHHMGW